jgi:spore coat polysaccharide biosynthesis protein SpsF
MTNLYKKNVALIVARLSSSRLPKKNIMHLSGKPMIERLIERIQGSSFIDEIVITTSSETSDDELEIIANEIGISCFRGSLTDVMQRMIEGASSFSATNIIEILGDNPFIHSELIDDVAELYLKTNVDYAATATKEYSSLPSNLKLFSVGVRVQIYSLNSAMKYYDYKDSMHEDSHPSSFIFENPKHFKLAFLEAKDKWSFLNKPEINFAINYPKNFEFAKKVFQRYLHQDYPFTLKQLMQSISEEPSLLSLLGHEEGFEKV